MTLYPAVISQYDSLFKCAAVKAPPCILQFPVIGKRFAVSCMKRVPGILKPAAMQDE
jgi:hypothetical protein